jgi:hypothetical protein
MLVLVGLRGAEREWRSLYGTHLSLDERFLAALLYASQRETREVFARLRAAAQRNRALPAAVPVPQVRPSVLRVFGQIAGPMKGIEALTAFKVPGISSAFSGRFVAGLDTSAFPWMKGFASAGKGMDFKGLTGFAAKTQLAPLGRFQRHAQALAMAKPYSPFSVLGVASAFQDHRIKALTGPLVPKLAASGVFARNVGIVKFFDEGPLAEWRKQLAETAVFMRDWEEHPLWFLLSAFGMNSTRVLLGLTHEEVEEALLDALEGVVLDGEYVAALRDVVADEPLNDLQRDWLSHSLEHTERGEWSQAIPPFLAGFEGALANVAVTRNLIEQNEGKIRGAEYLLNRLSFSSHYTLFIVHRVYGGTGNRFRHGRADSGERRQMLYSVVALAGWLDAVNDTSALSVLAERLAKRLPAAVERVTQPAQLTT